MRVGMILIGDELLDGRTADRNGHELGRRCREAGVELVEMHITRDEPESIGALLVRTAQRADLVVTSGGLGPTLDDTTRSAFARTLGVALEEDPSAAARLRERYALRGIALSPANRRQAFFPAGALTLENPWGTAEGFEVVIEGTPVIALPGVPDEFGRMLVRHVVPRLADALKRHHVRYTLFGVRESALASQVEALDLPAEVRVTYCSRFPVVELELSAESEPLLAVTDREVRDLVAPWSIPDAAPRPADAVVARLRADGLTLATAESCTGGLIASRLTDVPGASACLIGGWVSYANQAKSSWLHVSPDLLAERGAVSAEVARAMASGARASAGADVALAVTGIAGPGGGSEAKPVGTVYLAVEVREAVWTVHARYAGLSRGGFKRVVACLGEVLVLRALDRTPEALRRIDGVRDVWTEARTPPRGA